MIGGAIQGKQKVRESYTSGEGILGENRGKTRSKVGFSFSRVKEEKGIRTRGKVSFQGVERGAIMGSAEQGETNFIAKM